MTTTLRIDDTLKGQCDLVLADMGLNLSCAITIFLKELARRRAMPFAVRSSGAQEYVLSEATPYASHSLDDRYHEKFRNSSDNAERGFRAKELFSEMRQANAKDWTLDEINAEIAATRAGRRVRKTVRK